MTLAEYLKLKSLDDEGFARRLTEAGRPVDRATVTKWRLGQHTPRPPFMRAIINVTDGKVSAADLLAESEPERAAS